MKGTVGWLFHQSFPKRNRKRDLFPQTAAVIPSPFCCCQQGSTLASCVPMATVGEQLRKAREASGMEVQDVAQATNMRADHVTALEEGNFQCFPAPVYIRGSVRTYARLLKIDETPLLSALNQELSGGSQREEASGSPKRRKGPIDFLMLQLSRIGLKRGLGMLAAVVLIAGVVYLSSWWSHRDQADPLANVPPARYEPASELSNPYLPLPEDD